MIKLGEIGEINPGIVDNFVKKTTLQSYLNERGWLKTEVIFYDKTNNDYRILKNQPTSYIEQISSSTESYSIIGNLSSLPSKDYLINKYDSLYNISPRIRQYYKTPDIKKSTKERLKDSGFVTKFLTGIDSYTDILSLSDFLRYSTRSKGIIDLQVLYSKSGSIYNYNTVLDIKTNVIAGNDDIKVEYLDGVIKLFPKNTNIEEYIIDKCVITYGRE